MRYTEWQSEQKKTVKIPVEPINFAHRLNDARNEAQRAAHHATMVPDFWCSLAAVLIRCADKLLLLGASSYSRRIIHRPQGEQPMLRFAMFLVTLLLLPAIAFAQASMPSDLTTDQALTAFLQSLGGLKGAGTMAIVLVIVQTVMLFFRTPLAIFAGKYRLLIVAGLSLVGGFVGLLAGGLDWKLALMHSSVLGAVQVFGHQVVNQFKPETPPQA